jgi:hypothetical protein
VLCLSFSWIFSRIRIKNIPDEKWLHFGKLHNQIFALRSSDTW